VEFFKVEEPSKIAKLFGFRPKKSRGAANEVLQQYIASDIEELGDVVNGIQDKWRKKQSKASGKCMWNAGRRETNTWCRRSVTSGHFVQSFTRTSEHLLFCHPRTTTRPRSAAVLHF
jgi:hypothetical protein